MDFSNIRIPASCTIPVWRNTPYVPNTELARRGSTAVLARGDSYFNFQLGEAADWLDRTVQAPTLSSLSLEQWIAEFDRLKKLNADIMKTAAGKPKPQKRGARGSDH